MHIKDYIQAAYNTLQKEADTKKVLASLRAYLNRRGLLKFYPRVLRGLLEKVRRSERSSLPRVIVAREHDLRRKRTDIATVLESIGGEKHEVEIDPSIIGGFVVTTSGIRIDHSYKSKLLNTYRALQD